MSARPARPPAPENVICRRLADIAWALYGAPSYIDGRAGAEKRDADDFSGEQIIDLEPSVSGLSGADWLRAIERGVPR